MKIDHRAFLPIILTILAVTISTRAQTCNLEVSVYDFENRANQELIIGAKIRLETEESDKNIRPADKARNGSFENLKPGSYWTSVSKAGYKTTTKWFEVNCDYAAEGTVKELVFLWKGAPSEEEEMANNYFSPQNPADFNKFWTITQPGYPPAARAVRASGRVQVHVVVNEIGQVIFAKAISGHNLLRMTSVEAAKAAKFKMTLINGRPFKMSGVINFDFIP